MSRNAAGTYSLPAGNPVVTNSVISSTWANTTLTDIASALTDSLSRSGLGSMTAGLPLFDGTIGLPGLTFATETTAGLRRASAGNFRFTIGGVDVLTITATSVTGVGIPNLAAANTFTQSGLSTPAITLASAIPVLLFHETDAAANNGKWYVQGNNEAFQMGATNDAFGTSTNWILVNRTGTTIDDITIAATAVVFGASNLSGSGTGTWTGTHTFSRTGTSGGTSLPVGVSRSSVAGMFLRESGAAANNRLWDWIANGETMQFRLVDDAETGTGNWLTVDRTGTTVDRVAFPTDNATGNVLIGPLPSSTVNSPRLVAGSASSNIAAAQFSNTGGTGQVVTIYNAGTSGDNGFMSFNTDAGITQRGSINYNRGGGLTAFNVTSDARLKKNIRDSKSAIPLLNRLKIRAFEWKESKDNARLDYWLVAQELYDVMPVAVSKPEDEAQGTWGLDTSILIPLLAKALQEHEMRISAIESK